MALRSPQLLHTRPAIAASSPTMIRPAAAAAVCPSSVGTAAATACCRPRRSPAPVSCSAAADAQATGAQPAAPSPASGLLALKDWGPTCAAIAAGEQTILLRKGGIKEGTFRPAARSFLLFPTAFHTDAELLKPAAAQRYAAEAALDPKSLQQLTFGVRCTITGG